MAENLERMVFSMDLSQGQVRTGGGDNRPLEPGYYRVRIAACGKHSDNSVKVVAEVIEGEHTGSTAWIYLGTDASKLGNQNAWKTALASMGFDAGQLGANTQIDTDMFIEKSAYLRVLPQRDDATKTDRALVTAEEYNRKVNSGTAVGMTVTSVPAQTVTAPKAVSAKIAAPQPNIAAGKLAAFAGR